jgi:hypothetical protein
MFFTNLQVNNATARVQTKKPGGEYFFPNNGFFISEKKTAV